MNAAAPLPATSQGTALSRVDGRLKVSGAARYPAEFAPPNVAHAYAVTSNIAHGTITEIDSTDAKKAPGVLAVITHLNALKLNEPSNDKEKGGIRIEQRQPLSDATIHYGGQYVAVVVAETFEQARDAAALLKISYHGESFALKKEDVPETAKLPNKNNGEKQHVKKGNVAEALKNPDFVTHTAIYSTPTETHNPMECSATVAEWPDAEHLIIYDATQFVKGAQAAVAEAFGLKRENVRVFCPFVGGAFGCKGPVWPHTILAVMAAKMTGRPVKLEVTRPQMFSTTGHRTPTVQTISLAASRDGKLQAISHHSENLTSPTGMWIESCAVGSTNVLYDAPNIEFAHAQFTVNVAQPSFMRAPGECPGTYALESAMDELAYALKMDPLKLRLINCGTNHPIKDIPFSAKHLRECYELGAEKFDWSRRTHEPGSMREGNELIGWGMATATYPANRWEATVYVKLSADGMASVQCATHDLGTGAYTAFTQISADALGLPIERVKFDLGTSDFPNGPVAGGSNSTATVGSAIVNASRNLIAALTKVAVNDRSSPLHGLKPEDITIVSPGYLGSKSDVSKQDSYIDILRRNRMPSLDATGAIDGEPEGKLAFQSFGAHFCEVRIDRDLPEVRVTRVVSVMNCGRVINLKTGGSQIIGGVVMGIGMALEEETVYDPGTGLPLNRNLADYHVPVNADVVSIEPYFVGEPDFAFNPMGARGMGEIGITGIAAAIANAVYHATGLRVRDLPITPDKLI